MVPRMWCSLRVIVVLGGYCTAARAAYDLGIQPGGKKLSSAY